MEGFGEDAWSAEEEETGPWVHALRDERVVRRRDGKKERKDKRGLNGGLGYCANPLSCHVSFRNFTVDENSTYSDPKVQNKS